MENEQLARSVRYAINPRCRFIDTTDLPAVLRYALDFAGVGPQLSAKLTKRSLTTIDNHRGLSGLETGEITSQGYAAAARAIEVASQSGALACLLLYAQAAKRHDDWRLAAQVAKRLCHASAVIEPRRLAHFRRIWRRRATEPARELLGEPTIGDLVDCATRAPEPTAQNASGGRSPADALFRMALRSKLKAALPTYRAAINAWIERPDPVDRDAFRREASALPFPTLVVAPEIAAADDKSTMPYLSLGLPLPLLTAAHPVAFIIDTLHAEFPWMMSVIEAVELDLLVSERYRKGVVVLTPRLLVGQPGCGKTTFCRRLAELLGTPSILVSAAGSSSAKLLTGCPRGWSSARPSLVAELIAQHRVANPLVMVDEVDKAGGCSQNGIFTDALLSLLEPSSAAAFFDEFVLASCDVRNVSWIGTANTLDTISAPLLSRLAVTECPMPDASHMPAIAAVSLRQLRERFRLPESVDLLDDQARAEISMMAPLSDSARACDQLCREKVGQSLRRQHRPPPSKLRAAALAL